MVDKSDEEQPAFAAEQGCVLYTCNIADFCRLHAEWVGAGREHSGLILVPQQRFSVGEQLRRIMGIRARITAVGMKSRVVFLGTSG